MDVRIDEARENQLAAGVDDLRSGRRVEIAADARDGFAFDVNIGPRKRESA